MSVDESMAPLATEARADRYLIVSADSHSGPRVMNDLRKYCPAAYLERYDAFAQEWQRPEYQRGPWDGGTEAPGNGPFNSGIPFSEKTRGRTADINARSTGGEHDPHARLRDMDSDGITTEVIFHGALTPDVIPFQGPWGMPGDDLELQGVGLQMYNRWLADFVSVAPERFIGAAYVPTWDIEASVKTVRWAKEAGLKCINFPAPNRALTPYNDPAYEPFWSVCAETGLALTTHGGSGDMPPYSGAEAWPLFFSDLFYYSRRGLHYLTWAGVFERYPTLKYIFVEQRSDWVKNTLEHLDSIYYSEYADFSQMIPRPPSEYFAQNCYVASSFMSRQEAEMRHDVGIDRLMWGSDYPHYEGTWGYTDKALRATFSGMPVGEVAKILGGNAVRCFGLDETKLRQISDKIGPLVDEVDRPLRPEELPDAVGCSFRTRGTWS